jgi:hypothetical protein
MIGVNGVARNAMAFARKPDFCKLGLKKAHLSFGKLLASEVDTAHLPSPTAKSLA